jgi:hypothetical protein
MNDTDPVAPIDDADIVCESGVDCAVAESDVDCAVAERDVAIVAVNMPTTEITTPTATVLPKRI